MFFIGLSAKNLLIFMYTIDFLKALVPYNIHRIVEIFWNLSKKVSIRYSIKPKFKFLDKLKLASIILVMMLFALYSQKLLEIKLSNHSENWLSMWMTLPKEVVLFSPSSSSHRFLTLIRFVKETLQSFDPQTRYSCIPVILFSITLHSEQSNVKNAQVY